MCLAGSNPVVATACMPERSKGPIGTTLKDLIFVKQVIISRKMMEKVQADQSKKDAK